MYAISASLTYTLGIDVIGISKLNSVFKMLKIDKRQNWNAEDKLTLTASNENEKQFHWCVVST